MSRHDTIGKVATHVWSDNVNGTFVRYHNTVVVEFTPEKIRLNSGGWRTATTKLRMNQTSNQFGLGFSVFQHKRRWYVDIGVFGSSEFRRIPFEDGMVLSRTPASTLDTLTGADRPESSLGE